MTHKFTVAILALSCASCVKQEVVASQPASSGHSRTRALLARQVENAVDLGEGDAEARKLRQKLAANAKDLDARIALAKLYKSRGLPDLAIAQYQLAAELNPDLPAVTLMLAKALRDFNDPADASSVIAAFVKQHPKESWELLSLQGILEDEQGRFQAGESAYRAALTVDAAQTSVHNNLGYNLLLQGHAEQAAEEFRRAIALDPHSIVAHNNLGTALMFAKSGKSEQAFAEWRKSADPAAAHTNLAAIFLEQGHYAEARQELTSALKLKSDYPPALANLRLVAAADGGPATPPAPAERVNLWKRMTSGHSKDRIGKTADSAGGSGESSTAPQK
jgi:Flp pilus assembly protein TadD